MEYTDFGQFNTFSKTALESAKELESINGKVVEQLVRKNMDLFNSAVEMNKKFVALFGEVKNVQDLVTQQMELAGEYNDKVISTIKEAADIVIESKDEYQTWFEAGLKNVTEVAEPKTTRKKAA